MQTHDRLTISIRTYPLGDPQIGPRLPLDVVKTQCRDGLWFLGPPIYPGSKYLTQQVSKTVLSYMELSYVLIHDA